MNRHDKVRLDLLFYLIAGIVVYSIQTLLYLIDYGQRDEHGVSDYLFLILLLGINAGLIYASTNFNNWARNAFLVKFALMGFFFYPQTWIHKGGSWIYSENFLLGAFQRITNFSAFAFELFFSLYLIKRSVRMFFVHK